MANNIEINILILKALKKKDYEYIFNLIFSNKVIKIIMNRVINKNDIEDMKQEIRLKLYLLCKKIDKTKDIYGWFIVCCKNTILDYYDKRGNRQMASLIEEEHLSEKARKEWKIIF